MTPCLAVEGPVLKGDILPLLGFGQCSALGCSLGRFFQGLQLEEMQMLHLLVEREVCSYLVSIGNCIKDEMIEAIATEAESSFGPAETAVNSHKLEASNHSKAALVWAVVIAP